PHAGPAAVELRKSDGVWSPGFSRPNARVINAHDHFDAMAQCHVLPAEAGTPNLTALNSMAVPGPLPVEGRGGIASESSSALVPAVAGDRSCPVHGRPITSIIELRNLLAERFPNVRLGSAPAVCKSAAVWPTGLPQIDRLLGGGLPKSAMTELVSTQLSSGS